MLFSSWRRFRINQPRAGAPGISATRRRKHGSARRLERSAGGCDGSWHEMDADRRRRGADGGRSRRAVQRRVDRRGGAEGRGAGPGPRLRAREADGGRGGPRHAAGAVRPGHGQSRPRRRRCGRWPTRTRPGVLPVGYEAEELVGRPIDDGTGARIGVIRDLVLDESQRRRSGDGRVRAAVRPARQDLRGADRVADHGHRAWRGLRHGADHGRIRAACRPTPRMARSGAEAASD